MNLKSTFSANNLLLITYLTGGVTVLLSCLILGAWYAHSAVILQINQAYVPMQFNTALGFLSCGAALWLAGQGRAGIAALVGSVAGALGLLTGVEYISGYSLGIDQLFMKTYIMTTIRFPGRMAPSTAFCFLLICIAMWFAWRAEKTRKWSAVGLSGSLVTGLGAIGALGYFTNLPVTYIWGNFSSMALHTALAFVALGVGLLAYTFRCEITARIVPGYWRAAAVALATMTIFIGAAQSMLAGEENAFRSKAEVVAQAETTQVKTTLELHMQAIERMAERSEIHLPSQLEWEADAQRYVEHANGIYTAIEWLDPTYQVRWKIEEKSNANALVAANQLGSLIDSAKQDGQVRLLPAVNPQGNSIFLIVAPIYRTNTLEGVIVAFVDPQVLFNKMQIVSEAPYDFIVKDGSEILYSSKKNMAGEVPWVQEVKGTLDGVEWELEVWPTSTSYSIAPWFVLLAGLLSSAALTVVVLKSQAVNARLAELLTIIDTAPIGMLVLDANGHVRQINMEGEKLFGYTRHEIAGAQVKTLIHELHGRELTKYTDSFIAQPAKCRHKDGRDISTEVGIKHILINGQEHILVVVTDITQRKRAETELEEKSSDLMRSNLELQQLQQLLQTTIDHMPALVGSWDIEFRNRFGNKAYLDWFGMTPEQMHGKYMWEIIGADRFAQLKPHLLSVLQGNSEVFERTLTFPNGEVHHGVFSYVPDIVNGVVNGFYGFVSDVTQLKQAQLAKDNVLTQLQDIIDAAKDFAIIETDRDGTVTLFSRGAEILLGYNAQEIVGKAHLDLFHLPADIDVHSKEISEKLGKTLSGFDAIVALANLDETSSRDWTYVHRDRSQLLVSLTIAKVHDKSGNITGYLGIAKDIRKEKEILHALADARDKAQSANLAKSQFLANMSHELRTPMNAILGMLQLLQHTPLTTRQLDYTVKTQSAAQALLSLLNDILDFSKVEAGKMKLEHLPFRLDNLMRDLSVIFSSNVGDKEIDLLFSIDPTLPPCVLGDEMRLRQILINLAGNAIKFTRQGSVVVALKVVEQNEHVSIVNLSVQDTGIGIDPEHLNYVFEGFSQAEASTTRRFGGTGLGLAISQRLVALMGGHLKVESTLGIGSRFYFDLSLQHADFDLEGRPAVLPKNNQQRRVLIVDDSDHAREILLSMTESLGWISMVAESGEAALDKLKQAEDNRQPYDVVFMDWKMPGMDGIQTAAQMRRYRRQNGEPVIIIMVTAHDRELLANQSNLNHNLLDGFLVKPVTASMLFDAVINAKREAAKSTIKPRVLRLAGLNLLVVEDNLINQEVARELLKSEGAIVHVANDGKEGVDRVMAADANFDAVLMDIQMPIMDGYEATRSIRSHANLQTLPIIATTANAMASDKEACRVAGMNAHVAKPIDIDELVNTILRCCEQARQGSTQNVSDSDTPGEAGLDSIIALESALKRLGGNTQLFARLAARFHEDATGILNTFREQVDSNDIARAAQSMHSLKGIAGTVGAMMLAGLASEIELLLKSGRPLSNIAEQVRQLDGLTAKSAAALDTIIAAYQNQ